VDRFDADGIGIFGPESTNPLTSLPLEKRSFHSPERTARRQRAAVSRRIVTWCAIMRATLHEDASNTYYGQWNARILRQTQATRRFHCPE